MRERDAHTHTQVSLTAVTITTYALRDRRARVENPTCTKVARYGQRRCDPPGEQLSEREADRGGRAAGCVSISCALGERERARDSVLIVEATDKTRKRRQAEKARESERAKEQQQSSAAPAAG